MEATDILELAGDATQVAVADGEVLIADGEADPSLYVLEAGTLDVRRSGHQVARLVEPGSVVGELGLLLGTPASADVVANGPVVVRRLDDAETLFRTHPEFGRHLAVVLARRLRQVTSYLADLQEQFADQAGTLGLVSTVGGELLGGTHAQVDSGSEREPDSPY